MKYQFETETCSRCRGSGTHSFCPDYGSRCFKCRGKKVTLTKRGLAASNYFDKLCATSAGALKPGDEIEVSEVTLGGRIHMFSAPVAEQPKMVPSKGSHTLVRDGKIVNFTWNERLEVKYTRPNFSTGSILIDRDALVRLTRPRNQEALLAQALAYQKTLTKAGTERKRSGGLGVLWKAIESLDQNICIDCSEPIPASQELCERCGPPEK